MEHNQKTERSLLPMVTGILTIVGYLSINALETLKQITTDSSVVKLDYSELEQRYQAFSKFIDIHSFLFAIFCLVAGFIALRRAKNDKVNNFFAAMTLAVGAVFLFGFFRELIWKLLL